MSYSYSYSETETFTITHARQMASKVATDLYRFNRFYGEPTPDRIDSYEEELVQLLKFGYLDKVTYGFQRDDKWTEAALQYRANELGGVFTDDDPGKIKPGIDITRARFCSFLSYSNKWYSLSTDEKTQFKQSLSLKRSESDEPLLENGYWAEDRTYSAGGRALNRNTVRRIT